MRETKGGGGGQERERNRETGERERERERGEERTDRLANPPAFRPKREGFVREACHTGWNRSAVFKRERDFSLDNVLVRVHVTIELIWWTGLASWGFGFPFPGCHISCHTGRSR